MGRVLVVESDPVFAALMEDRLREAGHQVELCENEDQAMAAAARGWSDVVVLDLDLPMAAGGSLVRAVRDLEEGRPPRVLAISGPLEAKERVEVLRAGADDLLVRPIHFDELVLRVDRLSRSGHTDPMVLEGSLATYSLWELLQPLVEARRRGRLMVWGRRGGGSVEISGHGRVVAAAWERLSGAEALLALLGVEEGSFRFVAAPSAPPEEEGERREGLEVQRALLEAAWLKDELDRRAESVPATGEPLAESGLTLLPSPEPDLPALPVVEVLQRVRQTPGTRLFDLLAANLAAPQRVLLTVAWLCEKGVLVPHDPDARDGEAASTVEITRQELLDSALDDLVWTARERGIRSDPVSILLLAEPAAWRRLTALFTEVEEGWRPDVLPPLLVALRSGSGGSCVLATEEGEVALHVRLLDEASQARIAAVAPACAGAVVWLGGKDGSPTFRRVAGRFDLSEHGVGFAVAASEESSETIRRVLAEHPRWRLVPEAPRNLLAVFRLLRGGGSSPPAGR